MYTKGMAGENVGAWRGNEELYRQFCAQVVGLTDTAKWVEWLDFQRKFHHYSSGNTMLISMQYPHASFVGSRRFWQARGRDITEEGLKHPIKIWCPIEKTVKFDQDTLDAVDPAAEGPKLGKRALVGWILGKVYDKDQTFGAEIPIIVDPLQGEAPQGMFRRLQGQAEDLGFVVSLVPARVLGSANGECNVTAKTVKIRDDLEPAQQAKTLAHELAHGMMHGGVDGYRADRGLMELEAESVAYLVCHSLGLDTSDYSLGYVASWASGGGRIGDEALIKRLKAQARRVQTTSSQIIKQLEKSIALSPTLDDEPEIAI